MLTPAGRLLRRSAHAEDRPSLFAAQFALSHACWLVTYPLAGWVGAEAGVGAAFTVLGILALAATMLAAWFWPADDEVEVEHVHQPFGHEHLHVHDEHHHMPMRAGKDRNRTPILTGTRRSATSTRWSSTGIMWNGPGMVEVRG